MRTVCALALICAAACGPTPTTPTVTPAPTGTPAVGDAASAARGAFENPGGMWTPAQLVLQSGTLKKLGLEIDPAALGDPMAHPLGAVIFLGGCTASFVSPEGLIITNHHCATGTLQFNSTPDQNLLEDGYVAKTRAEEKSNGPAARVFVTQAFADVTEKVRAGIGQEKDDKKRYDLVEQRIKDLIAGCEKDRKEIRCSVVSYYGGEQYVLIEQLEIRDVRLVYAPTEGIGNFGGEIDNWRWPRHVGDYAFFRAYVGPDGKPADFDPKNVPYRPKHHLKIAKKPLGQRDLVMVAGYPAETSRLRTAREAAEAVDWFYPRRQKLCEEYIVLLEKLAKEDEQLAIKGRSLLRGLNNTLTNTKGMIDGLVKGGLKNEKARLEDELGKWVSARPEHAGAKQGIANLATHYSKYRAMREHDAVLWELKLISTMIGAADAIVHMAEERPKPDAERHPNYQERNHKRLEQSQQQQQQSYARRLDKQKLTLALTRAARLAPEQQPKILKIVLGMAKRTPEAIEAALEPLYQGTELESAEQRIKLLREATTASLKQSDDPFIKLALQLRPEFQASEDREDSYEGANIIDRPLYTRALRAKNQGVLAPDANRTLRVTFGTVRGYKPKPDAETYVPFTKLSELVAKHTGKEPFNAPATLLDAALKPAQGPYVHGPLGEVPVDFLADLDITGGNSGSPTLNAKGELVGLAFDGNYEAMASDWVFIPSITRSIHVDIRYVLWMMDRVDKVDHLLVEMGIEPRLE